MKTEYKLIIGVCILAVCLNIAAKTILIQGQNQKIILLQKVIAAARSGSYLKKENPEVKRAPALTDDIQNIQAKIPKEISFTEYVSNISKLMDQNGFTIERNLAFVPEKITRNDLLKYKTRFETTASYPRVKQFIADVLNLPGLIYFDAVKLIRDKDRQDMVRFQFELAVFFKKETV